MCVYVPCFYFRKGSLYHKSCLTLTVFMLKLLLQKYLLTRGRCNFNFVYTETKPCPEIDLATERQRILSLFSIINFKTKLLLVKIAKSFFKQKFE